MNILNKKNNSGKITIEYKDLDQFELISDLLTKISLIANINNKFFNKIFLSIKLLDLRFISKL